RLYPTPVADSKQLTPLGYPPEQSDFGFQASLSDLREFIGKGWITAFDDQQPASFISKKFQGAIQNNALPSGSLVEILAASPLSEEIHVRVNGYANGWVIDVPSQCASGEYCHRNADGTYELEFILAFWPQRVFFFSAWLSAAALLLALGCTLF